MTHQVEFAVVVPCYNAESTIAATLRSVQAQTLDAWELVVVDDGSTDGSAALVEAASADDPRIRLISQPNCGVSTARNTGIAATTAPLIGLVDADDLWDPNFLEAMATAFADTNVGAAFCRARILDGDGDPTGATTSFAPNATDVDQLLLTNPAGTCSTVMIRRDTIDDVGAFETSLRRVEDQHWMIAARLAGWELRGVDRVLVGYRTSPDGLSADLDGMLAGWEAMIALLGDAVTPAQVRSARAEHHLYLARRAARLGRGPGETLRHLTHAVRADPRVGLERAAKAPAALRRRLASRGVAADAPGTLAETERASTGDDPLVSVVMPIYGAERYVGAAVQSVLDQTYRNFELLLVDDGSTDGSMAVCAAFDDERIRVITQENRGLPGARNTGIRHARGSLVALIDADDVWLPEKLAAHVAHLASRPEVGVSYSASRLVDEHGEPIGIVQFPKLDDVTVRDVICRNPIGNGSAPVIRRSVFDAIGFIDDRHGTPETHYFDEDFRYAEDVECWTRIAATTGTTFAGLPDQLTDYRVISGSLSSGTEDHYRYWLKHYAKVKAYAPEVAAAHGEAARGYQIRFYARRDLQGGEPGRALRWFAQAVRAHPKMVLEEPAKTVVTFGAIVAGLVLPESAFNSLMERVLGTGAAIRPTAGADGDIAPSAEELKHLDDPRRAA